jgi:DNA (cytosine-5)-methyltransferase 1
MGAYYNEHDPKAAAWLRELIKEGLIADGEVDTRSITDVQPSDLRGLTQCHFFAGIGGWSYALRLAGWDDARPVWTGSCPCQPFSAAGAQAGGDDPRHLWPAWFRLIKECQPHTVFGEQVESAVAHGWLDLVCDDLEGEGYAVGAVGLPACSVGAPHIRQRLWFVADAGCDQRWAEERSIGRQTRGPVSSEGGQLGHTNESGSQGYRRLGERYGPKGWKEQKLYRGSSSPWADLVWLPCRDGKARPTQPGLQPLAHGVSARVGRLRGYGNAIVPQVAAKVILAYMSSSHGQQGGREVDTDGWKQRYSVAPPCWA